MNIKFLIQEMRSLIYELNDASFKYYNTGNSPLSDKEFDKKIATLKEIEAATNIIYPNSPTQNVGAIVMENIPKKTLGRPMLSLDKIHSIEELNEFAGKQKIVGSEKLDGLSVRLCYEEGQLAWAATRGNGTVGSDITEHVKHFLNVPITISIKQTYIIDGEAIITKRDFETINSGGKYKNPRNLAVGTLGLLDTDIVAQRKLRFIAWDVIEGDISNSYTKRIHHALDYGFDTVTLHPQGTLNEVIMDCANILSLPCDGVVWRFDDIAYGASLGATSHHYNNGIAWKPVDETEWTKLIDIDWTMGRTGVLTPVAIFETVELEGTEVERANLHNLSVMEKTLHGTGWPGQLIRIEKKNMIIPQIVEAEWPPIRDNSV